MQMNQKYHIGTIQNVLRVFVLHVNVTFSFLGKQILKIYDGNDAVKRNQYRLITVPRIAKNEEVVVRMPGFYVGLHVS